MQDDVRTSEVTPSRWRRTVGRRVWCAVGGFAMFGLFTACEPKTTAIDASDARLFVSTSPSEQRVAQGAATLFTVTIERLSFTGPVTLATGGAMPSGVSVEFDPATLPPGTTQATARVSVAANAPVQYVGEPPLVTIPVLASGPDGLRNESALRVRLVASSLAGVTVNATPADFSLLFGESKEGLVTLARQGNYAGPTTVELIPTTISGSTPGAALDYSISAVAGTPDTWLMRFGATNPAKVEDLIRIAAFQGGRMPFMVRVTPQGLAPVNTSVLVTIAMPYFVLTNGSTSIVAGSTDATPVLLGLNRFNRFTAPISMSIENAPAGITGTFSPNPAVDDATGLTLSVAANVAAGTYVVDVVGTPPINSGAVEQRSKVTVKVFAAIPYRIAVPDLSVVAGADVSGSLTLTRLNGFAGPVQVDFSQILGLALPTGMGVTMSPNPLTQATGANGTVRVTTTSATPPGTYSLQATGKTAGFDDVLQTFRVTVTPPPQPTSAVARIEIEPRNAEITAPATQQYSVALYNAAGARIPLETGGSIEYVSAPSTVASIDPATGLAKGNNAGVATISARYVFNGAVLRTDATPLTVYAANSAGHYGSATISTNNSNTRTLRPGETLLFQLIVRNVNGGQVTTGVTPTVSAPAGGLTITPCTPGVGPCPNVPGYFFTMTAPTNAAVGSTVKVRYDVMGAGGEITMTIVP